MSDKKTVLVPKAVTDLTASIQRVMEPMRRILEPMAKMMEPITAMAARVTAAREAYERMALAAVWDKRTNMEKRAKKAARTIDDLTPAQRRILTRVYVDADTRVWGSFRQLLTMLTASGMTTDEALEEIRAMTNAPLAASGVSMREVMIVQMETEYGPDEVREALQAWGNKDSSQTARNARSNVKKAAAEQAARQSPAGEEPGPAENPPEDP
jgi:hypothetical protein